jgi:hypothetical protein
LEENHPDFVAYVVNKALLDLTLGFQMPLLFSSTENRGQFPPVDVDFLHTLSDLTWQAYSQSERQGNVFSIRPAFYSVEQVRDFLQIVYFASLHTEEGRVTQLRMLVIGHQQDVPLTARFDQPIEIDVQTLVRLAPTTRLGFRHLVIEQGKDGGMRIIGIHDGKVGRWALGLLPSARQYTPLVGVEFKVHGPGFIAVNVIDKEFELNRQRLRARLHCHEIERIWRWYLENADRYKGDEIFRSLQNIRMDIMGEADRRRVSFLAQQSLAFNVVRLVWSAILHNIQQSEHGGCLLVTRGTDFLSASLGKCRRVNSIALCSAVREMAWHGAYQFCRHENRDEHEWNSVMTAMHAEQDLMRLADFVASLATVDGAVVLNNALYIFGFGAEITVRCEGDLRVRVYDDPRREGREASLEGGMRHRSAAYFCNANPDAMAFVVSQDGQISVFFKEHD